MPMWLNSRQLRRNESIVGRAAGYKSAGKSHADVAQLAEQLICNQQVNGSSPFIGFLGKRKSLRKAKDSEVMNDDLKGILERQFANSVCSLSFALQMTLPFLINLYKQACKVH